MITTGNCILVSIF